VLLMGEKGAVGSKTSGRRIGRDGRDFSKGRINSCLWLVMYEPSSRHNTFLGVGGGFSGIGEGHKKGLGGVGGGKSAVPSTGEPGTGVVPSTGERIGESGRVGLKVLLYTDHVGAIFGSGHADTGDRIGDSGG